MTTIGPGFSDEKVAAHLDIIDEILPNSPNNWERVAVSHCNLFPDLTRNTKSLKRKFKSLYNHKKPTGDPTCPVAVRKAKQIWEEIKSGMDFSDAEGELDLHVNVAPPVFAKDVAETAPTAALQAGAPEEVEPPKQPAAAAPVAAAARTPVVIHHTETPSMIGQQINTPRRQPQHAQPSTITSDLIQFMMLHAELEDKRHTEREEREERRARQREEAEEQRCADQAEERRKRSALMRMLMIGLLD